MSAVNLQSLKDKNVRLTVAFDNGVEGTVIYKGFDGKPLIGKETTIQAKDVFNNPVTQIGKVDELLKVEIDHLGNGEFTEIHVNKQGDFDLSQFEQATA